MTSTSTTPSPHASDLAKYRALQVEAARLLQRLHGQLDALDLALLALNPSQPAAVLTTPARPLATPR